MTYLYNLSTTSSIRVDECRDDTDNTNHVASLPELCAVQTQARYIARPGGFVETAIYLSRAISTMPGNRG